MLSSECGNKLNLGILSCLATRKNCFKLKETWKEQFTKSTKNVKDLYNNKP